MKTTLSQRLEMVIKHSGFSDTEIAKQSDRSKQEISRWKKGTKQPLEFIAWLLERFPEINSYWYVSGNGNMLNETTNGEANHPTRYCTDPVCEDERETLQRENAELKDQLLKLQHEKIKWLEQSKELSDNL